MAAAAASSSTSSGCAGASQEDTSSKAFKPIVFFLITYLLSAFAQELEMLSPPGFRVPHSVVLFLSGLALGRVGEWLPDTELGRTVADFMAVDPHIIFWVLLPALLYEDSSSVKWHVMKKVLPSALLLAVPGVIVNALLTGAIIKGAFGTIDWTWDSAFLLGTILSATDPVAVVGALHELAAPDRLSLLIAGESLFNDGSAVVIFGLFWDSARGVHELTPGYSITYFVRLACGGPLLGLALAFVAFEWLKQTRRFSIEILVIVVTVYGSFFVAEHSQVKVSGVLAVVIFGFFMSARGHFALNIEESNRHHSVIRFLALLSNEAIFLLAGVVSFKVLLIGYSSFKPQDWLELVFLYFIIHGTRALILLLSFPLLRRWGYGCSVKEALICLFGGLRGAVGLAMALMVEHDSRLDDSTRARIAFHTSGIVLATLLINGTFITAFYKKLHVYQKAQHHEKLLRMALMKVDSLTERRGVMFEQHWFFHNCHFTELFEAVPNLVRAAEELEHGRRGGSSAEVGYKPMNLNEVMHSVATRLGTLDEGGLHERYMQKLRYRRRWARSASNVFTPASLHHANDDETNHQMVIGLAMRMANLDVNKNKVGLEVGLEVADVVESEDSVPSVLPSHETTTKSDQPSDVSEADELSPSLDLKGGAAIPGRVPTLGSDVTPRTKELKPPSAVALPKPMVAWSDDDKTRSATPSRRPGSRVQFADEDNPEMLMIPSTSTRREHPIMSLPSEMGEKDQRLLYMHLYEESRAKMKEARMITKHSAQASLPEEPASERAPTPAPVRKSMPKRTNLQAQLVDALFSDGSMKQISSAISMAIVTQELRKAVGSSQRARAHWKIAKVYVFWALRKIQNAMEEHQKLVEGAEKGARLTKQRSQNHILGDSASMVEIHHMILNTTRCAYKEMYEAQSLPEGPYRVLMESLELQEEAIDGELQSVPSAKSDKDLDMRLQALPSSSHEDQMALCFTVAWLYLAERENRAWDKGYFAWRRYRVPQWLHMQHDITMMLAFIMTSECIAEDLEVIQEFEEQLKRPMLQVTEKARASYLYDVMTQNPSMFCLFEHLLCLRLMLHFQKRLVQDLVHDGLLGEEDANDLISRVIQPLVTATERYVPTREHLRTASRHCSVGKGGKLMFMSTPHQSEEDTRTVW